VHRGPGMLSLTSAKSGVLIGVFISVTTVPAAGFAAIAASAGHWTQCDGALLQLLINVAGITLAGTPTLLVRRHHVLPTTTRHTPVCADRDRLSRILPTSAGMGCRSTMDPVVAAFDAAVATRLMVPVPTSSGWSTPLAHAAA
jgi:hypothetical protein